MTVLDEVKEFERRLRSLNDVREAAEGLAMYDIESMMPPEMQRTETMVVKWMKRLREALKAAQ